MIYLYLFLALISLLSSCAEPGDKKICKENGQVRSCTKKEEVMIDGIQAIIKSVYHFDDSSFKEKFLQSGNNEKAGRQVIFLGESHIDIIAQMETLGAINMMAVNGGTVLLEGLGRNQKDILPCDLRLLYRVYTNWEWEKLGRVYDPMLKLKWTQKEKLLKALIATKDSYDLHLLHLSKLKCGFWDDTEALKERVSKSSLKKRNQSMVLAIKDHINEDLSLPLMISTGYAHMPIGDFSITKFRKKHQLLSGHAYNPGSLDLYYSDVRRELSLADGLRTLKLSLTSGTTEPIYRFLVDSKVSYREYLHKRMLR